MNDTNAAVLRRLLDRQEIEDCIRRVSRGMDRHDAELVQSCFHPDSRVDYGTVICAGPDFPEWANRLHDAGLKSHLHYLSPIVIDIEGDEAHAETYVMSANVRKDSWELTMGGGRYIDRLERRDGQWRISDRACVVEWWSETATMEHMAPLVLPHGQDKNDPSYVRPFRITREFVDHTKPAEFF